MSRVLILAKSALVASIGISLAVIGGVHYKQYVDRLVTTRSFSVKF
jgi:hypothetical protein